MSSPLPSAALSSRIHAWLRRGLALLDNVLPRAEELAPAVLAALIGAVPLAVAHVVLASREVEATTRDLWRVTTGELQAWCLVAFFSALALRWAPRILRPAVRFGVHAFATLLLVLSIVELVFYSVTGGRVDLEILAVAWEDAPQVAPVFWSEVQGWHLAAVAGVLAVGLGPALLRFAARPAWVGRLSLLLVVIPIVIEGSGRPRPRKSLRILQPSLIERLWWDGVARFGDETLPPEPASLAPVRLVREEERPPYNVVMVLLESQGAASSSLYDPSLDTTPNLAALAAQGFWVRNATSVVPHTSKAIVTTMCGSWPQLHSEIREARIGGLPGRCLPDLMRELGYRTAFFQTADERFENRGSLVRNMGFEFFRSRDTLRGPPFEKVNYFGVEERAMLAPGLAWSTKDDQPFFATYLTLSSHHDYGTPSTFEKHEYPDIKERRAKYLNAVRFVDGFVGELVEAYRQAGLLDNTLFVLLGDHGEAFGEHGRSMHDLVIWDEGLHIPMVIYAPGILEGTGVIEGPRQQIDVLPTVLDVLGVRAEGGSLPGQSLFTDVPADRKLNHSCWSSHRCLAQRVGTAKTIDHYRDASMQHFDLAADPIEKKDQHGTVPANVLDATRAELREWRARVNGRYEALEAQELARRQVPDTTTPATGSWGGAIELLGCTVETPEVLPAEAVWLRCRWRAREELRQAWRLVLGLDGNFAPTTADLHPLDGRLPTYKWPAGYAIEDDLRIFVPPDAQPGPARISVGWSRYGSGVVAMDGGGERMEVGTVNVLPPLYPYTGEDGAAPDEVPSEDPGADGNDEAVAAP